MSNYIYIVLILGDGPSDNGSIYQLPRTNRLLSVEPIFCLPTSGSANLVRSAYVPGSRPRGLSLEPNGIPKTRFRSSSTPRYNQKQSSYVRFISYSRCSIWRRISKLSSNFGCLFTFCYLDGANSIKTDLHISNLWIGWFVSYMSVLFF